MTNKYRVIGIRVTGGYIPMAWLDRKTTVRELRRATKKFRNDSDFIEPFDANWSRFYGSIDEMKSDIGRYYP